MLVYVVRLGQLQIVFFFIGPSEQLLRKINARQPNHDQLIIIAK